MSTMTLQTMTGHQKLAVVCMSLGPEAAAEITRRLPPQAVEQVTTAIATMGVLDPTLVDEVLLEWENAEQSGGAVQGGGADYAKQVLERAFGARKAAELLDKVGSGKEPEAPKLTLFKDAEPKQVARMLSSEHPQTAALVVSQLETEEAAEVLKFVELDESTEILHRMGAMQPVVPEILEIVATALEAGSELYLAGAATNPAGPESVAAVLNRLPGQKDSLLAGIGERDNELVDQVRNLMFVFEDLVGVDKRSLQALLQNVETKDLALSMKVASEGVKEKVQSVMSQRALSGLNSEIEFLGPVRVSEVEEAQRRIIAVARQLEQSGEMVLSTGGDDELL